MYIFQGVSNAYEIVNIQKRKNTDLSVAEPYMIPNPIAKEYETPVNRECVEPPNECSSD